MIELEIDGQVMQAEEGQMVLDVAREADIDIPTLCYHDAVSPSGACHLCIVEIRPRGSTVSSMAMACNCLVGDGMEVWTRSAKVLADRHLALERLLAKDPNCRGSQKMAAELGLGLPSFPLETKKVCILCKLCVRVCREALQLEALKYVRGREDREPHIEVSSNTCIGCGACSLLCPTGFIKMEEAGGKRIIWGRVFAMKKCSRCGSSMTTEAHWKYLEEKLGRCGEFETAKEKCPVCRRDLSVLDLLDLPGKPGTSLYKAGAADPL